MPREESDEEKVLDVELKGGRIELNTACMATLLAHMTGFASINAFGVLQQSDFFRQSWQTSPPKYRSAKDNT